MNPTLADLNPFMFDESVRFDESVLMEAIETALQPEPLRVDELRRVLAALECKSDLKAAA